MPDPPDTAALAASGEPTVPIGPTGGSAGSALLLLTDGRFPAGGYAHSGGLEPSVDASLVRDLEDLKSFLLGRVSTVGRVGAAFAAASCRAADAADASRLEVLDLELDARMPSPAQRSVSRRLGRQYVRVMTAIAPQVVFDVLGTHPHQPLALGVACAGFRLHPRDAALAALHESVAGPVAAAVRLLSLNPFDTHAALAGLGSVLDGLADDAAAHSADAPEELPADAAPLLDICAERHATQDARLFAS